MSSYQNAHDRAMKARWKTDTCNSGDDCWCRTIITETELLDPDGDQLYIVPDGAIDQRTAEHIVELHNNSLEDI